MGEEIPTRRFIFELDCCFLISFPFISCWSFLYRLRAKRKRTTCLDEWTESELFVEWSLLRTTELLSKSESESRFQRFDVIPTTQRPQTIIISMKKLIHSLSPSFTPLFEMWRTVGKVQLIGIRRRWNGFRNRSQTMHRLFKSNCAFYFSLVTHSYKSHLVICHSRLFMKSRYSFDPVRTFWGKSYWMHQF